MSIAMFVVLVVAALACLALIFGMDTSPATGGWHGAMVWLAAIALLLAAACFLLALAVGLVQP
jgi:type IV secretory pathway VirB2 component (pilin)